jgi:hypothetical protein
MPDVSPTAPDQTRTWVALDVHSAEQSWRGAWSAPSERVSAELAEIERRLPRRLLRAVGLRLPRRALASSDREAHAAPEPSLPPQAR